MIFGMLSMIDRFVPIFYGQGFDRVTTLIVAIIPVVLMIGMSNVSGTQYLLPTKKQKEFTISVVMGAIVNFVLNLFLIRIWGAFGASIATVFAETTVTGIQLYYLRESINVKEILGMIPKYLGMAFIMGIISYFVGRGISSNMLAITIQLVVGLIVYLIGLLLLKDEFMKMILDKVKAIFVKN